MKIATEFIVLHLDLPFPDESTFCPFIWESPEFDSDGDYYFFNYFGRWTDLDLKIYGEKVNKVRFHLHAFREGDNPVGVIYETCDLERYIQYYREGRYKGLFDFEQEHPLAVSSLNFFTSSLDEYGAFLETTYRFLKTMGGIVVNQFCEDAEEFKMKFLA